jgi:excisionase family DNA binding protein
MTKTFLTVPEVAAELRIAREDAYRMCREGLIPSVRLTTGRVRVPRDAFETWVHLQNERALAGTVVVGTRASAKTTSGSELGEAIAADLAGTVDTGSAPE